MKRMALITLLLLLRSQSVLALGMDFPPGLPLIPQTNWPSGLAHLLSSHRWVHGYFVNREDVFFYAGDAASFSRFLTNYAALPIAEHTLILHQGTGIAKSPWHPAQRLSCDWKMYIGPRWIKAALNKAGEEEFEIRRKNPGYAVTLELWLNGGVDFDRVKVPANMTVIPPEGNPVKNASAGKPRFHCPSFGDALWMRRF